MRYLWQASTRRRDFEGSSRRADRAGVTRSNGSWSTASAISLTVASTGALNARTTQLLTPEEMDAAAKRSVSYRAPGR